MIWPKLPKFPKNGFNPTIVQIISIFPHRQKLRKMHISKITWFEIPFWRFHQPTRWSIVDLCYGVLSLSKFKIWIVSLWLYSLIIGEFLWFGPYWTKIVLWNEFNNLGILYGEWSCCSTPCEILSNELI